MIAGPRQLGRLVLSRTFHFTPRLVSYNKPGNLFPLVDKIVENKNATLQVMDSSEANKYLKKHGATELSKSCTGRQIIKKAAEKYRIDLLQPGDPEFLKHYGKKLDMQKLQQEQNERKSRELWGEARERREFEARQKALEGTDWKSKRL